jgi:site-specific DNA-cytosine methylase
MATFGSLFAGIGGIDLGLERAGWACRWQVEWDDYCQRVLAKHWPDIKRYGDITTVDWSGVEPVDLLAGGFPCQPFSVAGRRKGTDDDRWLWPAFATAIRALRPRLVLVENVPGLLAGHGMGSVLGGLAELGYDAEWDCIPAAAVGAPHLRYRIWIVAYRPELGRAVADADIWGSFDALRSGRDAAGDGGPSMADADSAGLAVGSRSVDGCGAIRDQGQTSTQSGWWATEPDVRGMADGLSERLDEVVDAGQGMGADCGTSGGLQDPLRAVWEHVAAAGLASPGRRSDEQLARELADALLALPYGAALGDRENCMATAFGYVRGLRQAGEAIGTLRDPSEPLDATWLALSREEADWWDLAARRGPWAAEWPGAARVSKGVPARVDRLRSLGNAVVPQVVEVIGRQLLASLENVA